MQEKENYHYVDMEKPRTECGFVAIVSLNYKAGGMACRGISVLDNRGHEMTGVVTDMGDSMPVTKGFGTGNDVFPDGGYSYNFTYPSKRALAHSRYSTQGSQDLNGGQPHELSRLINDKRVTMAHVENGNLINTHELAASLGLTDKDYLTDNDLMNHAFMSTIDDMVKESGNSSVDIKSLMKRTLPRFEGAFTSALMTSDAIVVYSDHHGIKPGMIGKLPDGGTIVASEITALEAVDATFVREMNAGEMVILHNDGSWEAEQWAEPEPKRCLLELMYFMKPETESGSQPTFGSVVVKEARRNGGSAVAAVAPVISAGEAEAQFKTENEILSSSPVIVDFGFGVPNSGVPAGEGLCEENNIPYNDQALTANKTRRSFIEPTQEKRRQVVRNKLTAHASELDGKRAIGVEDSIIRGTTMQEESLMLKEAGIKDFHLRIALSMILYTCDRGVDLGDPDELLAARAAKKLGIDISGGYDSIAVADLAMMVEEMRDYLDVASLAFLTPELIRKKILGEKAGEFCMGCITGEYPDPKATLVTIQPKSRIQQQTLVV